MDVCFSDSLLLFFHCIIFLTHVFVCFRKTNKSCTSSSICSTYISSTIMQSVSQQCTDARSKINELQQPIKNIKDIASNEASEATQQYTAAVQHQINRHSSTSAPTESHTHHKHQHRNNSNFEHHTAPYLHQHPHRQQHMQPPTIAINPPPGHVTYSEAAAPATQTLATTSATYTSLARVSASSPSLEYRFFCHMHHTET